ncbi:MAG: PH domain-containing protein [Kiritimatiellaeota bacterium]|nr:PH domain-containing protein [Kiritimatiellota bacterium]
METECFKIRRDLAAGYFSNTLALYAVRIFAFTCPFTLVALFNDESAVPIIIAVFILLLYCFAFAPWLGQRQAANLRYRLEDDVLCVDGGVFFVYRKSIPVERITDIALVQGPILRRHGIWAMRIQTAGSPNCEATLYAVHNPEAVRELILSRRKKN